MTKIIDLVFVFLGIVFLCVSIFLSFQLSVKLRKQRNGRLWKIQTIMMIFFTLAYLAFLLMILLDYTTFFEMFISIILFFGAIFVLQSVFVTNHFVNEIYQSNENLSVELDEARERLLESKKIAALGAIAKATAHEINNPLAIILGFLRVIEGKITKGELSEKYFLNAHDKIKVAAKRITSTVGEFQKYSLEKNLKHLEDINLGNALINITEKEQHRFLEEGIQLKLLLPSGIILVKSTNFDLNFILESIINNAVEAMPDGLANKSISISAYEEDEKTVIRIKNNGPLIPENVKDKIFDPFFTTKSRESSKGISLSTCKATLMTQMGDIQYIIEDSLPCFEMSFRKIIAK